jgi:hypothetical protein
MSENKEHGDCLSCAMMSFHQQLMEWLREGGDKRLLEFKPFEAWHAVVRNMESRDPERSH